MLRRLITVKKKNNSDNAIKRRGDRKAGLKDFKKESGLLPRMLEEKGTASLAGH